MGGVADMIISVDSTSGGDAMKLFKSMYYVLGNCFIKSSARDLEATMVGILCWFRTQRMVDAVAPDPMIKALVIDARGKEFSIPK